MDNSKNIKHNILLLLKGIGIGAANVIPGVSGGTIALLTGIYQRLINCLNSFNRKNLKLLTEGKFRSFATATDLLFLAYLLLGILVGAFSLARLMVYLLDNFAVSTWSFFFGLVAASCIYVVKDIKISAVEGGISLLCGVAIAVWISLASPAQTPQTWYFIMLCGAIAACAMILPGISGSFMLVLLVKYEFIMNAIGTLNIGVLLLFAIGAVIGLLAFSRLLSLLLKKYYAQTMTLLTGFMVGSLVKLWPWQKIAELVGEKSITRPILPVEFTQITGEPHQIGVAIAFALFGIVVVVSLECLARHANRRK